MTTSAQVRKNLVDILRRDLIGPGANDADLARERLSQNPSRWYLTGFLAPSTEEPESVDDPAVQEESEILIDEDLDPDTAGATEDDGEAGKPTTALRFQPSSIGLTVLLPETTGSIEASIYWGDYVTEPPLPETVLLGMDDDDKPSVPRRLDWIRQNRTSTIPVPVKDGRSRVLVPDSAAPMKAGGALQLDIHARTFTIQQPNGTDSRVRAVTVFLINRRTPARRPYSDVAYAFQARLELACSEGFAARYDLSGYNAQDEDLRLGDLHYRDVEEYAVGRNTSAAWDTDPDGVIRTVYTEPMPVAEVERVAPNENIGGVEFGMEVLARLAEAEPDGLNAVLSPLPDLYNQWVDGQRTKVGTLDAARRRETAAGLIEGMETACGRIADGITLLRGNKHARLAFQIMNLAIARAARRRNAGATGDPTTQDAPVWRPFQLAFILLNLRALVERGHPDREAVDLLFFPTGGGKTEAYLGLAAFAIAHRRVTAGAVLGAGVTVIMRYTLRLLTLDQLSRAAGVVCALELMRDDPALVRKNGQKILGDWPIEIGLWVGSDASPNVLGGTKNTGDHTAVTRVRRYKKSGKRAPAPIKACPWCGTPFTPQSFDCVPNMMAPRNLEIRCANPMCDFTGDRPLPILTVDEPIYRRLPAFLIATVDKFASLPWVGDTGSFFGNVDRFDPTEGFFGAARPKGGTPLWNGATLDPPDLIIQDELHLISGPLGTVAGLYETAIDRLCTRVYEGGRVRPKIVASTATVRRAGGQIKALFDRERTEIFPAPGIDRTDSFFAHTVHDADNPARWYLGLAAQGRGPKLVFLRALTTLLSAAASAYAKDGGAADPYMTALCYFNALRELGGARRIVEDEVRDRVGRYGSSRQRLDPTDSPFTDRSIGEPMELTSRVSTDDVAEAKRRLEAEFGISNETVDVALATNMISVGLDITRLGLMVVQGQPKTAAEYIQATSRVGRAAGRPGLVATVLNIHKPRDRMHYEQFGQFHRTFYRAVEATSVTPWAARALDRALAAVVVSIARHLDPGMTPEQAVVALRDNDYVRKQVKQAIVDRAPDDAVAGGKADLATAVEQLMDDWIQVAEEQTESGQNFAYTWRGGKQWLLYPPLHNALPNLSKEHQRFVAGWSMRDVEPTVQLKVCDPWGQKISGADDLS
ncbi:MAG: hypothetical protein GKS00_19625 [Alphaproteobacteria bacterium]|nr:hypothetical protein [Alphaproteobacteria bacterium]